MSKAGMLSPEGKCKTFDNSADGFVPGEGIGVVILKSLEKAIEDGDHIYGVIKGSGINQDGKTNGITAPNSISQTALELEVYEKADVKPETVTYVEAHGTGTKLGDPIEVEALTGSFRRYTDKKQYCAIGSVKTNIGHTSAAAGVASVIKVLLSLKHKKIPPSINFSQENEHINFADSPFYVNDKLCEWKAVDGIPRRAAISSFGFSGTNCHMVIEEAPVIESIQSESKPYYLITLSAKTENSLNERLKELEGWITEHGSENEIGHISYTLNVGRSHFGKRMAFVVRNLDDLRKKIEEARDKGVADGYFVNTAKESNATDDPAFRELSERLIQELCDRDQLDWNTYKKKLLALASLYVKGVNIDWEGFYKGSNFRRISLPTYPFARERYWVQSGSDSLGSDKHIGARKLHALLDAIIPSLKGAEFKKELKKSEPVVRDHLVNGHAILPGVGYLEMACAAGDLLGEGIVQKIQKVLWLNPLVVGDKGKEVRIKLNANGEDVEYEISSPDLSREDTREDYRGGSNSDKAAIIHSKGKLIRKKDEGNTVQKVDIEAIRSRCTKELRKEEIYEGFLRQGISYGKYFQGLEELWGNGEEALGRIQISNGSEGELDKYILHPTIMDSALQGIAGVIQNGGGGDRRVFLPYSVEEVEILGKLTASSYSYVKLIEMDSEKGVGRFNIAILDEDGHVLVKIKDFCVREMKGSIVQAGQSKVEAPHEMDVFYRPKWKEEAIKGAKK
jgi:acyl transferase domain-containing protein